MSEDDAIEAWKVCPYGEEIAKGAGCLKEEGHAGAHLITYGDLPQEDF